MHVKQMRALTRTAAVWAALALGGTGFSAMGQQQPARGAAAPAASGGDVPTPIPGLTDKLGLDPKTPGHLLGEPFESPAAGIAFCPPAGSKASAKGNPDDVVEFVNADKKWLLKVTRTHLSREMPLVTRKDAKGLERVGILDYTVQEVRKEHPTAEVLRQEVVNVGQYGVGVAVLRVPLGTERYLRQQAIVQADEQLYYTFNLTTPAGKQGRPEDNPGEREAAETFKAMLDTIQLLDRSWIKIDQTNRLYRTRALFTDWNDKGGRRLRDAIVPEQWLRILRDGKDVGYSYVAEEFLEGKDVKNNPARTFDGVLVSIRSRTIADGAQVDLGSQMFASLDRKHEDWAQIVNVVANKGKADEDKRQNMEFGSSEMKMKRVLDREARPGVVPAAGANADANARDPRNPTLRPVESYSLRIERATQGRSANTEPETHAPSPWYIPQAVGSMLPRLLPLQRPVTYLFQSYVSDQHDVVHRYVDVGFEKEVTIGGKKVRAIPVTDRIRLEGTPTTHYMSLDGKYLGSVNETTKITILPTDHATLEKIWGTPDLRKQEEIVRPAGGAAGAQLPPGTPAADR